MAAKGSVAKEQIIQKILETFDGAFKYEKELRIPFLENGEQIQIKVALTCAKTNVDCGSDTAVSGNVTPSAPSADFMMEPTEEEKKKVEDLCNKLNIARG